MRAFRGIVSLYHTSNLIDMHFFMTVPLYAAISNAEKELSGQTATSRIPSYHKGIS